MKKTETVEEYLARGGEIEVLPSVIEEEKEVNVRKTTVSPATLYHITEGAILFGEKRQTKSKKKTILSDEEFLQEMASLRTK